MDLRKPCVLARQLALIGFAPLSRSTQEAVSTEPVATIEVTPASLVLPSVGDVDTLTAVARDGDGKVLFNSIVSWRSSDPAVVTVVSGIVIALDTGVAMIVASAGAVTSSPLNVRVGAPTTVFSCTQVIGFSQTSAPSQPRR